jgi:hypothetical protein
MTEPERQVQETGLGPSWVPDELATAARDNFDRVHVARYG